ncbi:hypothetical protein HNP47_003134 [Brevundimonas vesicularis]|uniref:Uncharacterized protein n=1 Tax=Brevundimonas vesicularis TaxID=41276 RepID=A0A7W9L754_BREVE|nr:hypothetical protein [Brevundimonas vesicularis]MBB5773110.1 hypothetical protein [Brevundimonas vesicularis]
MKRKLFDLCAQLCDGTIERRSRWISDEWLSAELAKDSSLDRWVDLPNEFLEHGVTYPLSYEQEHPTEDGSGNT